MTLLRALAAPTHAAAGSQRVTTGADIAAPAPARALAAFRRTLVEVVERLGVFADDTPGEHDIS